MVFGKRKRQHEEKSQQQEENIQHISDSSGDKVDSDIGGANTEENTSQPSLTHPPQQTKGTISSLKPLLDEIIISGSSNSKNAGGAKKWNCKHCKSSFTSSYTRIHYHFFSAPLGIKAQIKRCPALLKNRETLSKIRDKVQQAEQQGVSSSLKNSKLIRQGKPTAKSSLENSFMMMDRDMVDLKLMKGLCANGIPFNVLRNPEFVEMVLAINKAPSGYKPPSYEKARTSLLDECKRNVEKELSPVKETWYTQGVSVVSDGWSNTKHNPLINVLAVNSRGATFMYANDFSGIEKTGRAISEYLLQAIDEIGPSNVLQVITDNARNCVAAGKEIEKAHKHIFWSPCVVHTLNLIFKDFAENFSWLRDTYKRGKVIVKYFINHTHALALFRESSNLELLKVAKTRFASHYILLKRLMECREDIIKTVCLPKWKDILQNSDAQNRVKGISIASTVKDDLFWEEVEDIIQITKPLYFMVKFSDGDGPKMGEVYEKMDNMLGELKDIMKDNKHLEDYPKMEQLVLDRWEKMNIPMHSLGFALNPKFYDLGYLSELAPGGTERRAPNLDKEVIMGVFKAFQKISECPEEEKLLREEYARFHMKKGLYALLSAQEDAVHMDPIDWWSTYGSETPNLAEVAKKVLSQPISSSSAKRNWSTYSYIHSVKRNKLNCGRADKLVYIHSNIRLISRFSKSYVDGPHRYWDIDPENSLLEDSTLKMQDMRMKMR